MLGKFVEGFLGISASRSWETFVENASIMEVGLNIVYGDRLGLYSFFFDLHVCVYFCQVTLAIGFLELFRSVKEMVTMEEHLYPAGKAYEMASHHMLNAILIDVEV